MNPLWANDLGQTAESLTVSRMTLIQTSTLLYWQIYNMQNLQTGLIECNDIHKCIHRHYLSEWIWGGRLLHSTVDDKPEIL